MVKFIAFDYTGVISVTGPIRNWIENNLDKNDERLLLFRQQSHKWDTGELNLSGLYQVVSQLTSVAPDKIWDTFFKNQALNHNLIELIRKLKSHYKIILFSNHEAQLLRKLLENHKIADLFDQVIISSEHKMIKPDHKFFQKMLDIIGAKKDEVLFIDDSVENISGSNEFGVKAILFTNAEKLIEDLKNSGIEV